MSQKKHRRFFGNKAQVRVKRRGKSSPLVEQFARHEKPHAVQDKAEEGQPARFDPRVSSHHGPATVGSGSRRNPGEINDHPGREIGRDRIRLIAINNMKGAFGNEGALRFYCPRRRAASPPLCQATEGLSFAFFCSSGRTFSTSASAVIPCFFRKSGTAPCSMN